MAALTALTDLLLPPRCPACCAPATATWCGGCLGALATLALPGGAPVVLAPGVLAVAAYRYAGVARASVLEVKLAGRHAPARAMGVLLRARLGLPRPGAGVAWTWVPSRGHRVRARGVDLPRVLAGPGALRLLRRARHTEEQKGLAADARRRHQRGAFAPDGGVPPAVVLVDDVRTTGATALEAARALQRGGARRVLVVTFAAA